VPRAKPFWQSDIAQRPALFPIGRAPGSPAGSRPRDKLDARECAPHASSACSNAAQRNTIERILAGHMPAAVMARVVKEIITQIAMYKMAIMADHQERPAAVIAQLRRGERLAKAGMQGGKQQTTALQEWRDALPMSLRQELGAHTDPKKLLLKIERILGRQYSRLRVGRAPKGRDAELRRNLRAIVCSSIGDASGARNERKARRNERNARRLVAEILKALHIAFPDEKKNRKKFLGNRP